MDNYEKLKLIIAAYNATETDTHMFSLRDINKLLRVIEGGDDASN